VGDAVRRQLVSRISQPVNQIRGCLGQTDCGEERGSHIQVIQQVEYAAKSFRTDGRLRFHGEALPVFIGNVELLCIEAQQDVVG
jgi:hypothetical protein